MNLLLSRAVAVAACLAVVSCLFAQTPAPEVRATWWTRFEWPSSNQATAKANIDAGMQQLKNNNFNVVLFQVRGQCDVHYPSPYEPWTNTYNWTNPGWDPLAYAIQAAHSRGLEFHAYINTHALAASAAIPPTSTTPQHPYNLHGMSVPAAQSWLIRDTSGTAGATDSYYWISPGIPEASWWTRQAVLHVVKNYDVDGVHFDRIRTPGPQFSHDPVTEARFAGDGNPDGQAWADFMRSQITRDLRNIYGEIMLYKPHVKVSAAPFGIMYKDATTLYQGTGTQAYHQWYQDGFGWMNSHVVDFIVPMIYWEVGSSHPFELLLADWRSHTDGRHIVARSTTSSGAKTVSSLLAEHAETRTQNVAGHCVFSQGSMASYWNSFLTGPYDQATTIPQMPWKSNPTKGAIVGYVRNRSGVPVVDAKVNLTGDSYNYLTGFDGFFAILDVDTTAPQEVFAVKEGIGTAHRGGIAVTPGRATFIELVLGNSVGYIQLDKNSYRSNDTVRIHLEDGDLEGSGTIPVMIDSTSETAGEAVMLQETSPGVFTGTITLSPLPVVPGDGILQAGNGETITVYYHDEDTGNSGPADVTDTAVVDGNPPVITGVEITNVSGTTARVTFSTNEQTTGLVRLGASCGDLNQAIPDATGLQTVHTVQLSNLNPGTSYSLAVEVSDPTGYVVTDDNSGQCYQFSTSSYHGLPFYDGFESGTLGYPWEITGTGQARTTATMANGPAVGQYHMTMDSATNGANSLNRATVTLDMTQHENIVVSFMARESGDEPNAPPAAPFGNDATFDGVAVSPDGVNWYEIQPLRTLTSAYRAFSINLDQAIASLGLTYNGSFRVRFCQYDNFTWGSDGIAIDEVLITGAPRDDLKLTPFLDFSAAGPVGGPFAPECTTYTLRNAGTEAIEWSASSSEPWLEMTPPNGSLEPGEETDVLVCLDPQVNTFDQGDYLSSVSFTNQNTGNTKTVSARLKVGVTDYFTELFSSSDGDMDNQTFTFKPDGSSNYYSVCRAAATAFPTDPAGGTFLPLTDESTAEVTLADGKTVSLYDGQYGSFFVCSNGYLTFGGSDVNYSESLSNHFSLPRVSAFFDDLLPTGSMVSWKQLEDRVAVTYNAVPHWGTTQPGTASFQAELFFDGTIRLTYLNIDLTGGLVGLSRGLGTPPDFVESNFSAYGPCSPPAAPSDLVAAAVSQNEANLTWTDNADNETSFVIERMEPGGSFVPVGAVRRNLLSHLDQGLEADTTYRYRVYAENVWGRSGYSNEAETATPPYPPTAPGSLDANAASQTQIDVTWADNSDNETAFILERRLDMGPFAPLAVLGAGMTSYNDTGLSPDTMYYYRVCAENSGGRSGWSLEAGARTLPNPPAAPGNLGGVPTATSVLLGWTDNSSDEAGFVIECSTAGGPFVQVGTTGPDGTTFEHAGLQPGTAYSYRVFAHNAGGNSAFSNVFDTTTLPQGPANLAATAVSSTQVDLQWRDTDTGEQGFTIERRSGSDPFAVVQTPGPDATTWSDMAVAPGILYTYRVRSFNASGVSAWSNEASATPPPSAPVITGVNADVAGQLTVTWNPNGGGAVDFVIESHNGTGSFAEIAVVSGAQVTYTNSGLTPSTTYTYRMCARNAGGVSAYSNEMPGTTLAGHIPGTLARTIINPSPARQDKFGWAVAVAGNVVVVGAPWDDTGARDAGCVYVYDMGIDVPLAVIANPSPAAGDLFGWRIDTDGASIVVAAPFDDTGARDAGAAYVFDMAGNLQYTLANPGPAGNDRFGHSVAIEGTRAVIGAPNKDTGASDAGCVYVFDNGALTRAIPNPEPATRDQFGFSADLAGGLLVVGSPVDDANGTDSGSAFIYPDVMADAYARVAGNEAKDQLGFSVSAFGDGSVFIGATADEEAVAALANGSGLRAATRRTSTSNAGMAYRVTSGTVVSMANPTPARRDNFGFSVAAGAGCCVVGTPGEDTGNRDTGRCYAFSPAGAPLFELANPTPDRVDQFGWCVRQSGGLIAVSAPYDDAGQKDSGAVHVFHGQ